MNLFLSARVNMSSTALRRSCSSVLSVLLNSWNNLDYCMCVLVIALIWNCFWSSGMTGIGLRMAGGVNGVRLSLSYTVLDTINHSRPKTQLRKCLMTDAAFVLRNNLRALRVSKAGCPTIGVIVRWGKLSMILSEEDMMLVFDVECYPRVGMISVTLCVVEAAGLLHLHN